MPTAIEKALDFIGGMNTSASVPHSMDESTAKGILKYLHDLGVPVSPEVVVARGEQEGWNPEFTKKKWPDGQKKSPPVTASLSKTQSIFRPICRSSSKNSCELTIE